MIRRTIAPPPPPTRPAGDAAKSSTSSKFTSSSQQQNHSTVNLRKGQAASVQLKSAANGVSSNIIVNASTTAARQTNIIHFDLTNDHPAPSTTRKRALDEADIGDEIHVLQAPASNKRVRTVAAPTTMGAKVSQIVKGYESKAQDAGVVNPQSAVTASSSRGFPPLPNNSSSASSSRKDVNQTHVSAPVKSATRMLMATKPQAALSTKKSQAPHRKNVTRTFECERCTIVTTYDFDAHVMDELHCGNCNHVCCEDCIIKTVGEKCVDAEWHGTGQGYWQWRMKREKELSGLLAF